ncbi:MAG: monofunctional biosynthetic peptidoglycan transglycosylase [Pseudomonadota bacterium]
MARGRKPQIVQGEWSSVVVRWVKVVCALWIFSVVLLRFIAPPITPLMIIRAIEYWVQGESAMKGWEWKPLSYYPIHVQQAVVAAEDARFIDHWGVDLSAVEDALDDSDERSKPRGASTITMQTVKNVFLWPGRSYLRKVIEAGMAPIAGLVWGKRRTLELYLNIIEWGQGIYGLEAASRYYYNKPANQLDIREAAALASILPAPRKLSPRSLSTASQKRYQRILREAQAIIVPEQSSARAAYRWKKRKSE